MNSTTPENLFFFSFRMKRTLIHLSVDSWKHEMMDHRTSWTFVDSRSLSHDLGHARTLLRSSEPDRLGFKVQRHHLPPVSLGCSTSVRFLGLRFVTRPALPVPIACLWLFEVVTLALGCPESNAIISLLPGLCQVWSLGGNYDRRPDSRLVSPSENSV